MLRTLFSATILAGTLAGTAMAQAPDAGCALPSEPEGIPAAVDAAITGPADKDRTCMKALFIPEARIMFVSLGADGAHPLTELILADYLVVDVAKPYVEQGSFLEIELTARRGERHRTCGGRAPNDDVMDTVFTLLVNGGNGPVIRDGIDRPSMLASHEFPYLAPPNPDPPEAPHA